MSTILEHEQQALQAFQSNVADLAQKELDRLEAEREQLEQALTSVRAALRSVKATLAASLPKQSKNGSGPKAAKKGKSFAPSAEGEAEFRKWVAKQPADRDLTTKILFADPSTNWSQSYCNYLMKWGRENGLLRQSGMAGVTRLYRKLG